MVSILWKWKLNVTMRSITGRAKRTAHKLNEKSIHVYISGQFDNKKWTFPTNDLYNNEFMCSSAKVIITKISMLYVAG